LHLGQTIGFLKQMNQSGPYGIGLHSIIIVVAVVVGLINLVSVQYFAFHIAFDKWLYE